MGPRQVQDSSSDRPRRLGVSRERLKAVRRRGGVSITSLDRWLGPVQFWVALAFLTVLACLFCAITIGTPMAMRFGPAEVGSDGLPGHVVGARDVTQLVVLRRTDAENKRVVAVVAIGQVLEQRVGRVHRMGQRQSVQVLHFVTRGAIEERVRRVVEEKRALFDALRDHLGADKATEPQKDIAIRLGMTETSLKVAAHRMRKKYRLILRSEIAQTVSNECDLDDELQQLFLALAGC